MTKLMPGLRQNSNAFRETRYHPANRSSLDDGACDGQGNRGAGALRSGHAVGCNPQGHSRARQARAAGHAGRDPGGFPPARGRRPARATHRDRRSGRDRLRAGLSNDRPAHGRFAQRPSGALDRAVRRTSLRFLPGRRPGPADGAGQRRVAGTLRPGDAGRIDLRLRGRRAPRRRTDGPAARASKRPGAASRPGRASIERIDVATYRFAANMREPDPPNYFAAKYSLPHAAAALALRGHAGYHAFIDEVVRDPAIAALRRRVTVREDPELSAQVPRLKPARVTVTLTDGRQMTRLRESARGDYQDPYTDDEIRSKFRGLAGMVLSPAGVARVEGLVDGLDTLSRLGDLVAAVRAGRGA